MRDSDSHCRITRVVDGDDHDVQLAQLQAVMQRIQTALRNIPAAERMYIGNTLLNLAVKKMLGDEGSQHTATLLMRLSDAVNKHPVPADGMRTIDPGALHG